MDGSAQRDVNFFAWMRQQCGRLIFCVDAATMWETDFLRGCGNDVGDDAFVDRASFVLLLFRGWMDLWDRSLAGR